METKIRTGYKSRIELSDKAVMIFDEILKKNNIQYSETGYECLVKTEHFMKTIQSLNDDTSKRLRFFPDRTVLTDKATLVEIKYGKAIERDAYDNYMNLYSIGYDVGICFLFDFNDCVFYYTDIEKLKLKSAWNFTKKRLNIDIPIIDKYWYYPRELNQLDYYKYKNTYSGSGTAFAHIDFEKTEFKPLNP